MRMITVIAAVLLALSGVGAARAEETHWVGVYSCDQRVTGVTLAITRLPENRLRAVFNFYPHPSNPVGQPGSFEMAGFTDESGRTINLNGERWLQQPGTYNMVDFLGQISADAQSLTGAISAQDVPFAVCTSAALVRQ